MSQLTVAEFFAGIGLVRSGIEAAGFKVAWANDISPVKHAMYAANFDGDDYRLCDVRDIRGDDVPEVDLATASFPCIDLSLAGHRRGLAGEQSGLYFEFVRVLAEMGQRRPAAVLIENVPSFISSRGGRDLHDALTALNRLGYVCDLAVVDSRRFVPQSRNRLFVLGLRDIDDSAGSPSLSVVKDETAEEAKAVEGLRPPSLTRFVAEATGLQLAEIFRGCPPETKARLADVVERLDAPDERWWDSERLAAFDQTLPPRHAARIAALEEQNVSAQIHRWGGVMSGWAGCRWRGVEVFLTLRDRLPGFSSSVGVLAVVSGWSW